MSREGPPGNGVPHLQNLNALLAYTQDTGMPPMHQQMQNGVGPGPGPMNGSMFSNGSNNRKTDYVDSGVGEYLDVVLHWLSRNWDPHTRRVKIEEENSSLTFPAHASQDPGTRIYRNIKFQYLHASGMHFYHVSR